MSNGGTWVHTDSRGLAAGVVSALTRAASSNWNQGDPQSYADLRAMLIGAIYLADDWTTAPPVLTPLTNPSTGATSTMLQIGQRSTDDVTDPERRAVVELLGWPWIALAAMTASDIAKSQGLAGTATDAQAIIDAAPDRVTTSDGVTPAIVGAPEAGAWVQLALGGLAIVAAAAVWIVIAQKTADVVDRELAREEKTSRMFAINAKVLDILQQHRADEKAAGKNLPLSDVEKATMKSLQQLTLDALNAHEPPLPSVLPSGEDVGDTFKKLAPDTTTIALAAVAVLALLEFAKQ